MNYLDLFSGIGGFALGARWAGMEFEKHYNSDIDDYANRVYAKHFPESIQLGDITKIKAEDLPDGEWIITGGFPCQPFSSAGKQRGTNDDRFLFPEMFRIIRSIKPRWIIGENVGRFEAIAHDEVCSALENEGYETVTFNIPAYACGAWHKRERIWIIANNDGIRNWGKPGNCTGEESEIQGREKTQNSGIDEVRRCLADAGRETWETEPSICRVANGLPRQVDRNRVIGNSIVPQIAEIFFVLIKYLLESEPRKASQN